MRPRSGWSFWGARFYEHREAEPLDIHVHPGAEIGLVVAGEERIHFGSQVIRCRQGDAWLCAPWEPHGWEVPASGVRNLVLIFLPEFLGEEMVGTIPWLALFAVPPTIRPRLRTPETRRRVLTIASQMDDESANQHRGWQDVVRLQLLQILIELSRDWELLEADAQKNLSQPTQADLLRLLPALTLVHSTPERRVTVADAAAACALSQSRFQHAFRATMGISFGRFCLRNRLGLAAHLLLRTDRTLYSIAEETGFHDHSHLHRSFVAMYGVAPGDFRRQRTARGPGA